MRQEILLKTSLDVARIRKPSRLLESLFQRLKPVMEQGVTTGEIASFCEREMKKAGAMSAQKGYQGFPASVSISPNNVAAHGIWTAGSATAPGPTA
jgi:methionyl aminopeptidase